MVQNITFYNLQKYLFKLQLIGRYYNNAINVG